jgi:four helix bundle protein
VTKGELQDRTKRFALRVMRLGDSLPAKVSGRCLAGQLVRSGSSVAANYRAACRARSKAEFLSKLQIVIEEADETAFWLELVIESGSLPQGLVEPLRQEADEITAIMVASRKTASK